MLCLNMDSALAEGDEWPEESAIGSLEGRLRKKSSGSMTSKVTKFYWGSPLVVNRQDKKGIACLFAIRLALCTKIYS